MQMAIGEWLGTAFPIVLVWGMYTLLTSTDVLVLKHFRPAEDVGHYFAAAKILALVSIINFSVGAASAHQFTRLHVAGDHAGLSSYAAATVRLMFWPSLAVTLCVLALGRPLLMLFGPGFAGAYPIMAVLAVGQMARASVGPAERLLNMVGQQNRCALAYVAAFAVNIVGCVVLAPRFGGIGAAVATAAAFVTEALLLALIAKRSAGVWLFIWQPKRRSGARLNALRPQLGTER
jgi:O-antigen/teichoic acid export membrane protein